MAIRFKTHDVIAHTPPLGITDMHLQVLATYHNQLGYWHAVRVLAEDLAAHHTAGDVFSVADSGPEYSFVRHETRLIK